MSSFDSNLIIKDSGSHVCSAQSDSISSLQFDKRVKFRSYSSQFTLSNEVLVAIDRREELRPIQDLIIIEVDLSNGICNDLRRATNSKYSNVIRLDEMASQNPWVKKLTTYDTFVDKDVLKAIRDDAMEPNKLYLLKHQHKHQSTENMAGNYIAKDSFAARKPLRNTAAQFNPSQNDKSTKIDKLVYPSNTDNISKAYSKSKNILRNELIICTGSFQYPLDNNEQFSSSLSVDLATHELPQVTNGQPLRMKNDENINDYNGKKKEKVEVIIIEPKLQNKIEDKVDIEPILLEQENNRVEVDDIPFAEETDASEYDQPDSNRNTISKSLQYYLPVFDTNQASPKNEEPAHHYYEFDDNSRDPVSTDDCQSSDSSTDKAEYSDKEDLDSLNADDFDESLVKSDDNSLSSLSSQECIRVKQEKGTYDYNDLGNLDDIIIQENLVMHIPENVKDTISIGQIGNSHKMEIPSYFTFSEFDSLTRNISLSTNQTQYSEDNETDDDSASSSNMEHFHPKLIESELIPVWDSLESQSSMIIKNPQNNDDIIFSKSKSFSLKRNSSKTEEILRDLKNYSPGDNKPIKMQHPNYRDLHLLDSDFTNISRSSIQAGKRLPMKSGNVLHSDRREKFLISDLNSTTKFPRSVSEDTEILDNRRNSPSSSEGNTESVKRNDISINSSENSMIIRDDANNDFYIFSKNQNYDVNEILHEEEDETENLNHEVSNYDNLNTTSTEDIPDRERNTSSSDGLSIYSSLSNSTVNEIMLKDLVKTPINSSPHHFENFLKERGKRILSEKNEIGTNNKDVNENISENSKIINKDKITEDSSYTEDTSSSSSDTPQRVNSHPSLKRTSGFGSQLNELFNQENSDKNLLYVENNDKRCFSTSSDDNMSLRGTKDFQESFLNKMTNPMIQDKNTIPSNPMEKNTKVIINVHSDGTISKSEDELSQIKSGSQASAKERNKKEIIAKDADKPKEYQSPISGSRDSSSSRSLSTSSDDLDSSNALIISKAKFVDKSNIKAFLPNINTDKSLASSKHQIDNSSDSSRSLSTSTEELSTDKAGGGPNKQKISDLQSTSKENLLPISKKRDMRNSSTSSDQSISTSTEDVHTKKLQDQKAKFIDREEKNVNTQSIDKTKPFPIPQNRYTHLSNESDKNESVSTSSEKVKPEKLIDRQQKSVDREEKTTISKPNDKRKSLPISKKRIPYLRSESDNSTSLSTSTDNHSNQIELKESLLKSIESDEKLNSSPPITKQRPIPKKRTSISSKSFSTSTDEHTSKNELHEKDPKHKEKPENENPTNSGNKKIPILITKNGKEALIKSDGSDTNVSYSTSTEEFQPEIEGKQGAPIQFISNEKNIPSTGKLKSNSLNDNYGPRSVSTSNKEYQPKNERNCPDNKGKISTGYPAYKEKSQPALKTEESHPNSNNNNKILSSASVKKEPPNKDIAKRAVPNYYADRREKFTKGSKARIDAQFKRSASVPNYLDDSSSGSVSSPSDDENNNDINKRRGKKISQSSKTINEANAQKKFKKVPKCASYELISVVLKDNIITRFIENRRKYVDQYNDYTNILESKNHDPSKSATLSIDRREKFSWGEDINKIKVDNAKTGDKTDSNSNFSISTTSSSESDSEKMNSNKIKIQAKENQIPRMIPQSKSIDKTDNNKSKENVEKKLENKLFPAVEKTVSHEEEESDKESKESQKSEAHRENEIADLQNVDHHVSENQRDDDSLSISTSESISTSSDEEEPRKVETKDNNFQVNGNKKISPTHTDNRKEVTGSLDPKDQITRKRSKERDFSSTSSESESTSDDNQKSKSKSIDRREKFAFKEGENNLYKKPPKAEPPKQRLKRDSNSNSGTHSNIAPQKKYPSRDREEKFTNESLNHVKSEQAKPKSDSTDEDISFSLTSVRNEKLEFPGKLNNHSMDRTSEIFLSGLNSGNNSMNSLSLASEDQKYNKMKYDKNKPNTYRSYQTLPVNKMTKEIPIREKSRSLEKPLTVIDMSPLNQSVSGSLGDIIETRYYEYTENWSRQSPISSGSPEKVEKKSRGDNDNTLVRTEKKPPIDKNHISLIKDNHKFIKKKLCAPITTRPRPVPSYLSPINGFPYVPSDQEFGSTDSLVNDYSSDYNAEEFRTKYKSLPDFITSLSTTSLKKEPMINKTASIQKPQQKKKSSLDTINLNYGDLENEMKLPKKQVKREVSINSVTTDSSYLEKPILREKKSYINCASPDSSSSLTISSIKPPNKQIPKMKPTLTPLKVAAHTNNQRTSSISSNNQQVSSLSSSSDSDTPKESNSQSLTKISNPTSYKPQINSQLSKEDYLRKSNSLPQKRIPSSSESSELSSTSEEDSVKIYQF